MKIGPKDVYRSYYELFIHAESMLWRRFASFIIISTLMLLAWAALFTAQGSSVWGKVTMCLLSTLGMLTGVAWSIIDRHGMACLNQYAEEARAIEGHPHEDDWWDEAVQLRDRPFQVRKRMNGGRAAALLLIWIPLLFSLLNLILLLATWLGGYTVPTS